MGRSIDMYTEINNSVFQHNCFCCGDIIPPKHEAAYVCIQDEACLMMHPECVEKLEEMLGAFARAIIERYEPVKEHRH